MSFSKGDQVTVNGQDGGVFTAKVLSTDEFTDPDGKQLYGVKVLDVETEPSSYGLSEGQTTNVYPSNCS